MHNKHSAYRGTVSLLAALTHKPLLQQTRINAEVYYVMRPEVSCHFKGLPSFQKTEGTLQRSHSRVYLTRRLPAKRVKIYTGPSNYNKSALIPPVEI